MTAATEDIRSRYLDLLIKALTHTLYGQIDQIEPPTRVQEAFAQAIAESDEAWVLTDHERARAEGRDWPLSAQTMVGTKRLLNVRTCVETVLFEGIPGDLIETGVWRGGTSILMRGVLAAHGDRERDVWVADSFQGLPAPDAERYPADRDSWSHEIGALAISCDEVRENFRRYDLLDDRVRFLEGWFRDTLPQLSEHRWALVRLDGDMYESTMDGLVNLYDGIVAGGFLIIDDFALPSCREAVEDFRRHRDISEPIETVDWTGAFWRKAG